jgi:hypothetical protein
MTERDAIVARVLIEERWAHLHTDDRRAEASELSAMPVESGGLGRRLNAATIGARARGYATKRAVRLEEARAAERERRIDAAESELAKADARVAARAAAGDGVGYAAALRAYDRAETTLGRRESEHVALTRRMRESDEIDVALDLLEAMRHVPEPDRAHLSRSLHIEASLRAFARRLSA